MAICQLRVFTSLIIALVACTSTARADIYEWEYINPADPALGKQQSTTLVPHGAGAIAAPGTNLSNHNLTKAFLIGANFSPFLDCSGEACWITYADLTNATLAQADLTNASLYGAILTDADLTGAEVRGANFARYYQGDPGGITTLQLYSTGSYQTQNLSGIKLSGYNLGGINLSGQNLTGATLRGASLLNANFSGANLTDVDLKGSVLTNANVTGSTIRGATISSISTAQLYSTASHQDNDLEGINLDDSSLSGVNLAGQNLTRASFYRATLSSADFQQANLANANFTYPLGSFPLGTHLATNLSGANLSMGNLTRARFGGGEECSGEFCWLFEGANLNFANLSGADARHANFYGARMVGTNTENMIWSDGHIAGLNLRASEKLIVRNFDSLGNPVPIVVDQSLAMEATSALLLEFDAGAWESTISFASGIPVTLGGTLELVFESNVEPVTQLGRTFDLFDWGGVSPTGTFSVASPYTWNLSNLYITGKVTLIAVPESGDFNADGSVDAADYVVWRDGLGTLYTQDDYNLWRANFGATLGSGSSQFTDLSRSLAIPEPACASLLLSFAVIGVWRYRREFHRAQSR